MYIDDLRDEDVEIAIKVLIVGNGAVGKSSMIQRYCRGTFTRSYKQTIGVDFLEKQLRVHGEEVRLMLWDTAGQEEFDSLTKCYYRGAQACVFVFSTTDQASLPAIRSWRKKVEDECGDIPMVLVQNKIDLIAQAEVDQFEAEKVARELKLKLYRTSVKEDLNVAVVFQHLAENYVTKIRSSDSIDSGFHSLSIGSERFSPFSHRYLYSSDEDSRSPLCDMVRYRGNGRQNGRKEHRKTHRLSHQSDPPMIADYLSNPMFDRLHARDRTITLKPSRDKKSGSKPGLCRILG